MLTISARWELCWLQKLLCCHYSGWKFSRNNETSCRSDKTDIRSSTSYDYFSFAQVHTLRNFSIWFKLCTMSFSLVSQATIFILTWRSRLDPNREDLQAAQGDPIALKAYKEFHSAINHAKSIVKRGLLIDFHGFNKDWVIMFYILFTFWPL